MKSIASSEDPPEPLPPIGFCQCRCGGRTERAQSTNLKEGRIKGKPLRFLPGHQNRKVIREIEEDRGYVTPCRIWQLAKNKNGYGVERVRGRTVLAHRAAYERQQGEIEEDLEIDHLCGQPNCVRVDHLQAVTHTENLRRGSRTKLTRADVVEIRRSSEKQQVLADRYGITQGHVSRIKARLVWRDLPGPEMSKDADLPGLLSLAEACQRPGQRPQPDLSISKLAA